MSNTQLIILCACILVSAAWIGNGVLKVLIALSELCRHAEKIRGSLSEVETNLQAVVAEDIADRHLRQ